MTRDPMSGQERDPSESGIGTGTRYRPNDYDGPDRRAHDEGGPFGGLPQWARVIAIVGIPGAIACFTVWIGFSTLPKLEAELIAMRLEAERNRMAVQAQVTQGEQTFRMLQKICANMAKSDEERGRCFDR